MWMWTVDREKRSSGWNMSSNCAFTLAKVLPSVSILGYKLGTSVCHWASIRLQAACILDVSSAARVARRGSLQHPVLRARSPLMGQQAVEGQALGKELTQSRTPRALGAAGSQPWSSKLPARSTAFSPRWVYAAYIQSKRGAACIRCVTSSSEATKSLAMCTASVGALKSMK
jgi:hypothetical protein